MKLKNLIFIPVIFLVFCKPTVQKEDITFTTVSQNLPSADDVIDFDDFFEISEIIPLETNDSSIVDFIHKVLIDEYLFIKGGGALYKFGRNGEFISKVEKGNDGPNDFINLTDVILLPDQNRIWVYDSNQRNLLQFDYDFNFEISFKLGFPLFGIEKSDDRLLGTPGYMLSIDKPNALINFFGENLATGYSLENSFLPFEIEKSKYLHINRDDYFSLKSQNEFNFVNSFNDTIYSINSYGVPTIEYYIDFQDKKVLKEDLINKGYSTIVDVFSYINSTDKSFNVGNVFQSNSFLTFRFFNSGKPYLSIYNKDNNSLSSGRRIKFNLNDKEFILDFEEEMRIGSLGDGKGYISIPLESGFFTDIKEYDHLNRSDNPLIFIFHEK
ncbi:6-bladed beta-propeller [Algoriphagus sp.]|uniref:6-bladed beta-propeller n=1 Tax=Algoriphagus sp. TaxID=1872435 RepID=UPI0026283C1B|nr:6-bladed beta-propeller [Algoriphagus sp.]